MNGLQEIISQNAKIDNQPHSYRPCSVCAHRTFGGELRGVVLHSATNRDTTYIDVDDEFQWGYFAKVCKHHGIDRDALLEDPEKHQGKQLDKVVESYWGIGDQIDGSDVPGYEDDKSNKEPWEKWDDPDYDPDSDPRNAEIDRKVAAQFAQKDAHCGPEETQFEQGGAQ